MPQELASAKVTLSYPLYACDFDPKDATRLVVGGGGGAGKSGVGNKIVSFVQVRCYIDCGLNPPRIDSPEHVERIRIRTDSRGRSP